MPETPGKTEGNQGDTALAGVLTDMARSLASIDATLKRFEAGAAEFAPVIREALPAVSHLLHRPRRAAAGAWMRGSQNGQ